MVAVRSTVLAALLFGAWAPPIQADDKKPARPKPPKIRVSRETTYLTKPLDKRGDVDYTAALNARISNGVTPQNNAAVPIVRLLGPEQFPRRMRREYFAKLGIKPLPDAGDYFLPMFRFAERQAGNGNREYEKALSAEWKQAIVRPWSPRQFPKLAAWLKANRKHLDAALRASERSRWYSPVVTLDGPLAGTIIPLTQEMRNFPDALLARTMMWIQQDEVEEALRDLVAAQRLARLLGTKQRFAVDCGASYGLDRKVQATLAAILQSGKLSDGELRQYLQASEKLPPLPSIRRAVNFSERIMALDAARYVMRNRLGGLNYISSMTNDALHIDATNAGKEADRFFRRVDWNAVLANINREYDRIHAAMAHARYADRKAAFAVCSKRLGELKKRIAARHATVWKSVKDGSATREVVSRHMADVIKVMLVPDPARLQNWEDTARTRSRLTRLAVALERHRKAHGRFPDELADLSPRFLKTVPDDLFTEKPFVYKPTKTGYLLYSVGPNMKDDGGKERGTGAADDIAVRMTLKD